ncbi:hypothetical protein [Vibrio sp. VPAP30]|uniref:hypothetical protein n=1 Tax=Vibrio sp. VPAP30 TaxID=1647102 RepID=UPI000A4E6A0D|nr:hypothetical protein [Vibrio sp. VPAP30]
MLSDKYWEESPLFKVRCISIWDSWLFETNTPNLLGDATDEQEQEWEKILNRFHYTILDSYDVYLKANRKGIFKEIVNKHKALDRLSGFMFEFFIPDIKVIYSVGYDFTAHVYFQDTQLADSFFQLIENSELNFLNES